MSKCYVVGMDGSEGSIRAIQYAVDRAAESDASIKVIHVLEWSPYSFLTPEELDERHKRRTDELDRANTSIMEPVLNRVKNDKVDVTGEVRYGQIAEEINNYTSEVNAEQMFVGRHGGGGLSSRLFGSVPGVLVQIANVPVTVIP